MLVHVYALLCYAIVFYASLDQAIQLYTVLFYSILFYPIRLPRLSTGQSSGGYSFLIKTLNKNPPE